MFTQLSGFFDTLILWRYCGVVFLFVCGVLGFFFREDTFRIFDGLLSVEKVRKERSGGKRKLF